MSTLAQTTLTLFFTRRASLYHWDQVGSLDREVALYHHLAADMQTVNFITYGGQNDQAYADTLAPICVLSTPAKLPVFASQILLQQAYAETLNQSDIFKTNQIPGSEVAVWAKQKYNKKLITRCGYLYGLFMDAHTKNTWRVKRAYQIERAAFQQANVGVVTSERDRQWVMEHYALSAEKIHCIPNFVVTDVFRPLPETEKQYDLVCVSKASPQKNIPTLLEAMASLKQRGQAISLLLIGSAAQDEALNQQIEALQLDVTRLKRVANFELPTYLNQARCFILPSLYEGHPKALLEAMSCGCACIGSNVEGIKEDIQHEQTGYLCEPNTTALAQAIDLLLNDSTAQRQLGQNARQYIISQYSLDAILQLEKQLYLQVLSGE